MRTRHWILVGLLAAVALFAFADPAAASGAVIDDGSTGTVGGFNPAPPPYGLIDQAANAVQDVAQAIAGAI